MGDPLLYPFDRSWPVPAGAALACVLEAATFKVGNVHPGCGFENMHFSHFAASASVVQDSFRRHTTAGLGRMVNETVHATQQRVGCNTNLGTVLLLAPLACAANKSEDLKAPLQASLEQVLSELTSEDCRYVYRAIRVAQPGGLGEVSSHDVHSSPPDSLLDAMRPAASVDAVARQFVNDYADVRRLVEWLEEELRHGHGVNEAISRLQLRQLAAEPDGLIVRKLGSEFAEQVRERCQQIVSAPGWTSVTAVAARPEVRALDAFLRADGNRRNPGTTADLIAASLYYRLLV